MANTEIAQARAELEAAIAERDAVTDYDDHQFEEAEHQFDESPERKKVDALVRELLDKLGEDDESTKLLFELDDAIAELIQRTEEFVLGRIVIGVAWPGGLPCVGHWRVDAPTQFDPVEYTRKANKRNDKLLKARRTDLAIAHAGNRPRCLRVAGPLLRPA